MWTAMRLPRFVAPKLVAPAVHAAAALVLSAAIAAAPGVAIAADGSRLVGEVQGSGLVFKDTLRVEAFGDPKVKRPARSYLGCFPRA